MLCQARHNAIIGRIAGLVPDPAPARRGFLRGELAMQETEPLGSPG